MNLQRVMFWRPDSSRAAPVNDKKGRARKFFSKVSGAFMLPISVMSVAGLFLGIGAAIASNTTGGAATFGAFVKSIGDPIFGAMPVLFLIAVIVAFTDDVGTAVFAGVASFLVFNAVQTPFIDAQGDKLTNNSTGRAVFLSIYIDETFAKTAYKTVGSVMGLTALNTSIFAGIVCGMIIAKLYNRYHTIKLPAVISFFSGKRFISFIGILAMIPLAFLFLILWPFVGFGLGWFGEKIGTVAGLDSFVFGFVERALIPTGLHHVFYAPLWWTAAGGDVSETIQKSGVQILAINDGAISVDATNWANVGSLVQKLANLEVTSNGATTKVFSSLSDISATYVANVGAATAPSAATINAIYSEINAATAAAIKRVAGQSIAADALKALVEASDGTQTKAITDLNAVLIDTFGQIDVGDSFGWFAVQKSVANTVSWADSSTAGAPTHTAPIFQFLDQLGLRLGRFMQGKYSFMQFGLPAAGAAMVLAAPKENRKQALAIVVPAATTAFVTGVTEAIEFTFLFLAPFLFWGFHAGMAAFSFLFMNLAHSHIGMSFSGGFIDLVIYGIVPIQKGTDFWWAPVIGVAYAPIYFAVFYFWIKRFDLATPGRAGANKLVSKAEWRRMVAERKARKQQVVVAALSAQAAGAPELSAPALAAPATPSDGLARAARSAQKKASRTALTPQSKAIVKHLGGWDNIVTHSNCATRLRYDVKNVGAIDMAALKAVPGVAGVLKVGNTHVQIIMGAVADQVNENIKVNIGAPLGD